MAKRRKKKAAATRKRYKKVCKVKTVRLAPGVVIVAKSEGHGKRPKTFFKKTWSEAHKLATKLRRQC